MRLWTRPARGPALPPGYWVEETEPALRLLSPDGVLLQEEPRGRMAAEALEWRAWQDAWEGIERQIVADTRALQAGMRTIHELRRLRQYHRMLDAIAHAPSPSQLEDRRRTLITGFAVGAAAAVLAVALFTGPLVIPQGPSQVEHPASGATGKSVAGRPSAPEQASPAETAARRSHVAPRQRGPRTPAPAVRASQRAARSFAVSYIVSLGEFANQETADARARLVRSKGHVVYVARIGDMFHVVTRPYRNREYAERLASALQEIGFPARAQVATPSLL